MAEPGACRKYRGHCELHSVPDAPGFGLMSVQTFTGNNDYLVICTYASHDPTRIKTILPNLTDRILDFEFLGTEIMKYRASVDSIKENRRGPIGCMRHRERSTRM